MITATLTPAATMKGNIAASAGLNATITLGAVPVIFDGSYEYTPSAEEQTIPIDGMVAEQNITINPIPSNYGLITWNGSIITVS